MQFTIDTIDIDKSANTWWSILWHTCRSSFTRRTFVFCSMGPGATLGEVNLETYYFSIFVFQHVVYDTGIDIVQRRPIEYRTKLLTQ